MQPNLASPSRISKWLRWILFSEGLILLLAIAGPGHRYAVGRHRGNNHDLFARWFLEDPTFFEAVAVNFVLIHLFIGGVWLAARIVTRTKRQRG